MTDQNGKRPDIGADDESTVSRAYAELQKQRPPAHLDELILAEARRAAADEDRTVVRVHRWRRWTMPVALAATVIFAVPLVVRVFDNTAVVLPTAGRPALQEEPGYTMKAAAPGGMETRSAAEPGDGVFADDDAGLSTALVAPADRATSLDRETRLNERMEEAAADSGLAAWRNRAAGAKTNELAESEPAPAPQIPDLQETVGAMSDQRSSYASPTQRPAEPVRAGATGALAGSPDSVPPGGLPELESAKALILAAPPEHTDGESEDTDSHFAAPPDSAFSDATVAVEVDTALPATAAQTGRRIPGKSRDSGFASLAAGGSQARIDGEADTPADIEESIIVTGSRIQPEHWLIEIARLHQRGRVRTARRELGHFLTRNPDYELPAFFPLDADDAIYDKTSATGGIVPEAEAWLSGIGKTAERGEIDEARQQLAEFFGRYPDYPLPEDFPLTREDARPIER